MSAWKGAAIGAGAVAVLAGILLGGGIVSIRKSDGGDTESSSEEEDGGEKKKRRRGKKRGANPDLDSLAYLNSVPITDKDRGKQGVVFVDKAKAFDGLTLINPCFRGGDRRVKGKPVHEAKLWDLEGKVVHTWESPPLGSKVGWAIARLDEDGYLYFILADQSIVKLDWEGNVVWELEQTFHHDFNFDNDGNLIVVSEQRREVPTLDGGEEEEEDGGAVHILDHGVSFVSREGKLGKQIWFYDAFKDDPVFKEQLAARIERKENKSDEDDAPRGNGLDIFHANAVQVLPRDIEGLGKKGDLLVSARHLDTIATISRDTGKIIWSWGADDLQHQHDPTITPDGLVAVFDNGTKRKRSRVLVIDPKTNEIARTFDGGEDKFFSAGRGLAQSLPNGNLLVFISNQARVLEVTPTDEIAWEFYGPWVHKNGRLPLRGVRLHGKTLENVRKIVAGELPAPTGGVKSPVSAEDEEQEDGPDEEEGQGEASGGVEPDDAAPTKAEDAKKAAPKSVKTPAGADKAKSGKSEKPDAKAG